jgi:hypothetical protein
MATFIPGKTTVKRRRVAMQTALYHARHKNQVETSLVNDPASLSWGSIAFSANPSNGATITLGGTVVTFGTTVTIGASLAITLASLLVFLQASADTNIKKCTYSITGSILGVRSKTPNNTAFTLAASAATVSHATLQLFQISARQALG